MEANKVQVGGSHYKTSYEHWDLTVNIPMTYLEGCATKYVSRWRKKGGVEDLKKASHYLNKMIEVDEYIDRKLKMQDIHLEITSFAKANDLSYHEKEFILCICTSGDRDDLVHAQELLVMIIDQALVEAAEKQELNRPGTPEDGGHHAV